MTDGARRRRAADFAVRLALRSFQVAAIAEGGLLPAIFIVALIHWVSGRAAMAVAVIGASHGVVFSVYLLLTPCVARLLGWRWRRLSVAASVAVVPFATWVFERQIRGELDRCVDQHRARRE